MEKKSNQRLSRHIKIYVWLIPLLLARFGVIAQSQNLQITLDLKEVTFNQLFAALHEQSGLEFIYNVHILNENQRVTVCAQAETLKSVLTRILSPYGLTYEMKKNVIILRKISEDQLSMSFRDIKGRVLDEKYQPLPGATVVIQGSSIGTSTDVQGRFSMKVMEVRSNDTLMISFVGMKTVFLPLSGQEEFTVTLYPDVREVEEVVVNGIFRRRAESFTGSAISLTHEQLLQTGHQNLFQSIRNLDPALNIFENTEFGSDPNHLPDMQLRGTSSFPDIKGQYVSNPNLPLFILDGFESTLEKVYDLDMNRVESVTILKDAAAKAIYGSKAANGVMVIETIQVKPGELRMRIRQLI